MCSQMLPSCQVLHSISLRAQSFPLQVMGRGGKEMTSFLRVCHRHTSKIWSIRIATVKAKPLWVRECHHQLSDHRRKPALPLRNSALTKANLSSDMSSPHPKTVILGHILWNVVVYSIGFFFFFIGRELLYNAVLVSAIHHHESATGIHMSPPSWNTPHLLRHPTPLGCHRTQGWTPCVAQQTPTCYLFYIWKYIRFHAILSCTLDLKTTSTLATILWDNMLSLQQMRLY